MGPYEILGVPRDCTPEQAKRAFRSRVRDVHPDRGGDEAEFLRICEAYRRLLAEREGESDAGEAADVSTAGRESAVGPSGRGVSRGEYLAWMRRVSDRRDRRESRWWDRNLGLARIGLLGVIGTIGVLVLLAAVALGTRSSGHPDRRGRGTAPRLPSVPGARPVAP
jgi:hypothetical protein